VCLIGDEPSDIFGFLFADESGFAQSSLSFGALVTQKMAMVRLGPLYFTTARFFKSFGSTTVSLDLRH